MAIKKTVDFKGLTIQYAYIKVMRPTIYEGNNKMTFAVYFYSERGATSFDNMFFESPYSLDGPNPVKQGYEFIKTLDQFSGGEDC